MGEQESVEVEEAPAPEQHIAVFTLAAVNGGVSLQVQPMLETLSVLDAIDLLMQVVGHGEADEDEDDSEDELEVPSSPGWGRA